LSNANKVASFSSIAVSGQACSGKSTICSLLAQSLFWKHVNIGAEFRKLANIAGLEIEKFGSVPENQLRKVDQEITQRIRKEPQVIWDGRLACYLSRDINTVFKVYCTLPVEMRIKRLANREKITLSEARGKISDRDSEEKNVFERLYGLSNQFDPQWVNLQIDTSSSPDELIKQALKHLQP
jgi:predicted cytidylate kinase